MLIYHGCLGISGAEECVFILKNTYWNRCYFLLSIQMMEET